MTFQRVFVLVLDSLGVGALPDAARFGDEGSHTLDHLVRAGGGLNVPRLSALGLGRISGVSEVAVPHDVEGAFGRMAEQSLGKDTSTGHWEMMGCPLDHAFPVYPDGFPDDVIAEFVARARVPGVLENAAASGTEVIARLGGEHMTSGMPIVYTSADSVFQVAAHEEAFGLERLYEICEVARSMFQPDGPHPIGRVIARPFIGEAGNGKAANFQRTYNRRDFSLEPPSETVLDRLKAAGVPVVAVGKIEDIFAGRGVTRSIHTEGNVDGMRATIEVAAELERGLVFLNLVDFDMLYGHRRDPRGYARALEVFDADYARLEAELREGDLVLMTADHGNDPTRAGTDHTREYVPLLAAGPGLARGVDLGTRATFADLGATVAEAFGLEPQGVSGVGTSFLSELVG